MMQILFHTPTWVFFLFAGLLVFGLLQTRDRKVRKPIAYLLPIGMVALSLSGVHSAFGLKPISVAAWLVGVLLVTVVARKAFAQSAMSFDPQQKRFFVPGSWVPLAVIMGIFFTKYTLAVVQSRTGVRSGLALRPASAYCSAASAATSAHGHSLSLPPLKGLTIRSSRSRFAARLNSGVRRL